MQCLATASASREAWAVFDANPEIIQESNLWRVFYAKYREVGGWGQEEFTMVFWSGIRYTIGWSQLRDIFQFAMACRGTVSIVISKQPEVISDATLRTLVNPKFRGPIETVGAAGGVGDGEGGGWPQNPM